MERMSRDGEKGRRGDNRARDFGKWRVAYLPEWASRHGGSA